MRIAESFNRSMAASRGRRNTARCSLKVVLEWQSSSESPAMAEQERHDWQVPNFEADPAKRQDWIESQIQDGEKWWESQEASGSEKYLDLLSARGPEQAIKSNTLKSDIRKFVETISDIREIGTFGTGAEQFRKTAEMFNKVVKNIYRTSHFPRQARKALQWSVGLFRGYMWPRYIRTEFGWE